MKRGEKKQNKTFVMGAAIARLQSALGDKKAFVLLLQLGSTFYATHLFQFPAPVPCASPSFHAAAFCSGCQRGLSHPHHRQTLFRCCHFPLEASQRIRNVILALWCTILQILKSFGWTLPLFWPSKLDLDTQDVLVFRGVCLASRISWHWSMFETEEGDVWANDLFVLLSPHFFPPSSSLPLVLSGLWHVHCDSAHFNVTPEIAFFISVSIGSFLAEINSNKLMKQLTGNWDRDCANLLCDLFS